MELEIEVGEYVVEVKVTNVYHQPPQNNADSDWDYYGYLDVSYDIVAVQDVYTGEVVDVVLSEGELEILDERVRNQLMDYEEEYND